jgi:hypothetical protein
MAFVECVEFVEFIGFMELLGQPVDRFAFLEILHTTYNTQRTTNN